MDESAERIRKLSKECREGSWHYRKYDEKSGCHYCTLSKLEPHVLNECPCYSPDKTIGRFEKGRFLLYHTCKGDESKEVS